MMAAECSYRVFSGQRGDMGGHMCGKPAKHERGGKWFCAMHTPEGIAKRKDKQTARYKALLDTREARWKKAEETYKRAAEWPKLKQRIAELEAEIAAFKGKNYPNTEQADFVPMLTREAHPFSVRKTSKK